MTGVLIITGSSETDKHTGRDPCEHEAEMAVMFLEAKENQGLPGHHQELRTGWNRFSLVLSLGKYQP